MYSDKSMQIILMHTLAENHKFKWARRGARTLVSRNYVSHSKGKLAKSVTITRQDCMIKFNRRERTENTQTIRFRVT